MITLTKKQKDLIKKISGKEAEEVVQKVIDDWFANLVEIKYKSSKTLSEKIEELNK